MRSIEYDFAQMPAFGNKSLLALRAKQLDGWIRRGHGEHSLKVAMGTVHRWAVDDTHSIDALDAKLRRLDDLALVQSPYVRLLPWRLRLSCRAASVRRRYRDMIRLMRYEF